MVDTGLGYKWYVRRKPSSLLHEYLAYTTKCFITLVNIHNTLCSLQTLISKLERLTENTFTEQSNIYE